MECRRKSKKQRERERKIRRREEEKDGMLEIISTKSSNSAPVLAKVIKNDND
jgi:hypothetical protein